MTGKFISQKEKKKEKKFNRKESNQYSQIDKKKFQPQPQRRHRELTEYTNNMNKNRTGEP